MSQNIFQPPEKTTGEKIVDKAVWPLVKLFGLAAKVYRIFRKPYWDKKGEHHDKERSQRH